jgi:hypothetical protein
MYTITLHGNSSELSCDIFPALEVDENTQLSLLSLHTNNSIPNIEEGRNQIGLERLKENATLSESDELCLLRNEKSSEKTIYADCSKLGLDKNVYRANVDVYTLPTGSYELENIEAIIKQILPDDISFSLRANKNTLKCEMICSENIDFSMASSIGKLLGFKNKVYKASTIHESANLINIMKVNSIKVECNLICGSFSDGLPSQTIHEFYPTVPPGYKIIEVPRHLVYYHLNTASITRVNIALKDQNDNLINLRGEPITIRLQVVRHNHGSTV